MENYKICLTHEKINVQEALNFVNSPYCGATSIFIGTTRVTENGESEKLSLSLSKYKSCN